ncbi:MAG: NAD(+) diphosphatase [Candidatus Spyradocola sp.]|jgi:NAD+ diphosphatase
MLHDIAPHVYSNAFHPHPAQPGDKTFCFAQGGVYLHPDGSFPVRCEYPAQAETLYLFDYDGAGVYLSPEPPADCVLRPLRALRDLAQPDAFLGGTAQHLSDWYARTRFCGCCGARMRHSQTERAMVCPACGNTVYPRISPAVIVLITCGEHILLAQGKHYVGNFYSLIAGYLEIGESLEQAACREALEETGLHIRDLTYFGNQPWPFTDTQMVGFFAHADEREPIRLQEEELRDARWFTRDNMPVTAPGISIASAMIDAWRRGVGPALNR